MSSEPSSPRTDRLHGQHTLMTGFPGFLSTELLRGLLSHQPEAHFTLLILPVMCAVADRVVRELELDVPCASSRITLLEGDISLPRLGLDAETYAELCSRTTMIWHLAALYNLAVEESVAFAVNLDGTRNLLSCAMACPKLERFNYISTCYVSGDRTGRIMERELVKGQEHKNHYESTKFWAEVEVQRHSEHLPVTIFRPSIVVGDSRTGEIAKYDGPYYIFKLIDRLPDWMPLVNLGDGAAQVNLVPVDFVTRALTFLGTHAEFDGEVFHIADPNPMTARDVLDLVSMAFGRGAAKGAIPSGFAERALKLPMLPDMLDLPAEVFTYFNHQAEYDTSNMQRALSSTSIRVPHLSTYLSVLIDFYRRNPELGS